MNIKYNIIIFPYYTIYIFSFLAHNFIDKNCKQLLVLAINVLQFKLY